MPWEKTFDEETGNSRIFAFGAVSVLSAGVLTAEQKIFRQCGGNSELGIFWENSPAFFWGAVLFDSLYLFTVGMILS